MVGQLGLQTTFECGLDQTRDEAVIAGQFQIARIDAGEDVVQCSRRGHLGSDVRATTIRLFVGHEVHHVPFRWTDPLHRRSDTSRVGSQRFATSERVERLRIARRISAQELRAHTERRNHVRRTRPAEPKRANFSISKRAPGHPLFTSPNRP